MRGIIVLNGQPCAIESNLAEAYVICCDGAYKWARDKLRVNLVVGDFDSLNPAEIEKGIETIKYPVEKNLTDGEIAIQLMLEKGIRDITLYGFSGGREDHAYGNLQLLYSLYRSGANARAVTDGSIIYFDSGSVKLNNLLGSTITLAPFASDAHIISSEGLKYPLHKLTLRLGSCRGLSNVVVSNKAGVQTNDDVLVFINKG